MKSTISINLIAFITAVMISACQATAPTAPYFEGGQRGNGSNGGDAAYSFASTFDHASFDNWISGVSVNSNNYTCSAFNDPPSTHTPSKVAGRSGAVGDFAIRFNLYLSSNHWPSWVCSINANYGAMAPAENLSAYDGGYFCFDASSTVNGTINISFEGAEDGNVYETNTCLAPSNCDYFVHTEKLNGTTWKTYCIPLKQLGFNDPSGQGFSQFGDKYSGLPSSLSKVLTGIQTIWFKFVPHEILTFDATIDVDNILFGK